MTIAEIYNRLRELLPYDSLLDLFELRERQGDGAYLEIEALAKAHYELGEGAELDEVLALIDHLPISKAARLALVKPAPPVLAADAPPNQLLPVPFTPPGGYEVVPPHYHVAGRFTGGAFPEYPLAVLADDFFVVLEVHGVQAAELVMSARQARELGRHLTAAAESARLAAVAFYGHEVD